MRYWRPKYLCQRGRKNPISICLQKWNSGTEVSDNLPKRCQYFQLPDRSVCLCESKQENGSAIWTEFKAKQRTNYLFSDQVSCSSLQMFIVISPVSPFGNKDQCTVCLASLAKVLAIWNKSKIKSKRNLQTVKTLDTSQNSMSYIFLESRDCPPPLT